MRFTTRSAAAAAALFFSPAALAQGSVYTTFSVGSKVKATYREPEVVYDDGVDTFDGALRYNSDPSITAGLEVGSARIANRFRIGVSYDYVKASLDTVNYVGTLNGIAVNEKVDVGDLADALGYTDINLVGHAHFVQGQAAVNLAPPNARFKAVIGAGGGAALANGVDTGLAVSGTAALEIPVNAALSLGVRYRYIRASGWTDQLYNYDYEPVNLHLISVTASFFN